MTARDVLVIGAGPGGQKAAIQAAKLGRRVALIEEHSRPGGFCTHTGTIPSKSLRSAAEFAAALQTKLADESAQRAFLLGTFERTLSSIAREEDIAEDQLTRNGVEFVQGRARFRAQRELEVECRGLTTIWSAPVIIIATGSHPMRPEGVNFDPNGPIYDSDTILTLNTLPKSLIVEGGGVIGSEYACIFHDLGVQITLVNRHPYILHFLDADIRTRLEKSMRARGISMIMDTEIKEYRVKEDGVELIFSAGDSVKAQAALLCAGRQANVENLGLEAGGINLNQRGTIEVDENYLTSAEGVYAVGDVTGFPSLAAAAIVQGRRAVRHALQADAPGTTEPAPVIPMGIWTIPECSAVGLTEQELRKAGTPYAVGKAPFEELARAQIDANPEGFLKLLFCPTTLKLLGIHVIGRGACDLIHIGQIAMTTRGTLEDLVGHPANFPTYSGAYKVAAINGLNLLPAKK